MRSLIFAICCMVMTTGCATVMNDAHQQINFKAPGCKGKGAACTVSNKRGLWHVDLPGTAMVRRSDDVLKIECEDSNGNKHQEAVPSRLQGKFYAGALILDLGIVDSITDKHREYPAEVVIDLCLP